jgi:hypothetical protein
VPPVPPDPPADQGVDDRINDHVELVGMGRRRGGQRAQTERQHRTGTATQADHTATTAALRITCLTIPRRITIVARRLRGCAQ